MSLIKDLFNPKKYIGRYQPILIVALLSAFSLCLLAGIALKSGKINYLYLIWNIFLAWIPMFFAYLLYHRLHIAEEKLITWKFWVMTLLWLLFFPNAPYLITDLIHLNERHSPASHGDALLLFSFALSGLTAGMLSLYVMHYCFKIRFKKQWPEIIIGLSIFLTGYGIYLGRVERWNSWDIITNPYFLIVDSLKNLTNPTAIGMTFGFSLLIGMVYLLVLSMVRPKN